jgi:ketosteroid isomerase-like protein
MCAKIYAPEFVRDTARTMSQENVELVRRGVESVDAFWAMLDEYIVWDLREFPMLDLDGVYVGRDAVVKASRHYWGTWRDYRLDVDELLDAGSSVVVVFRERGRGKGSGAPIDQRLVQAWTFSRGRIVRWESFSDRAAALEAVGCRSKTLTPTPDPADTARANSRPPEVVASSG